MSEGNNIEVSEARTLAQTQTDLKSAIEALYGLVDYDSEEAGLVLAIYERNQEVEAFVKHQAETIEQLVEMVDTAIAAHDEQSAIRELYAERGREMAKHDIAKMTEKDFGANTRLIIAALDWLTADRLAEVGSLGEMVIEALQELGASVESDSE